MTPIKRSIENIPQCFKYWKKEIYLFVFQGFSGFFLAEIIAFYLIFVFLFFGGSAEQRIIQHNHTNTLMNKEIDSKELFVSIRQLIEQSRQQVAVMVNATMSMLYWKIGKKINDEVLQNNRAEYGKQIVATLWRQLVSEYGHSFSEKNLRRMMQFAETFSDEKIVASLILQLSWSHIKILIPIEDSLKRDFYIEMCRLEKWSVRTFRERTQSMLYERTAISKKPEQTIENDLKLLKNELA